VKSIVYYSFLSLSLLILSACGGGSKDEPQADRPDIRPEPVGLISSAQADVLIAYPISVIESMYQVSQLITPRISSDIVIVNGTVTNLCEQSGEYTVTHRDNDSSGNLTPDDNLELTFTDCVPKFTSQALTGAASINVLNASIDITGYQVNLDLRASDEDGNVQIRTQSINIESSVSDSSTQTTIRTVQNPFTISIDGLEDTFSSFDLTYFYDLTNLRYLIDFDFDVNSQLVDLDFTCESTQSFRGLVFQTPNEYGFFCNASANDSISVTKNVGQSDTLYQYTSAGDVSDVISFDDQDFYEGSLGFPLGVAPETEFASTALSVQLNASNWSQQEAAKPENVTHVLYDKTEQHVIVVSSVFSDAEDGLGSVVQVIDAASMELIISKRISSGDWISRAELSQSGQFLYAFLKTQEQNLVYVISTADLNIVDTIDLSLFSTITSIAEESVYIESMQGEDNSWIISYSRFASNESEFLVFDGNTLKSRGSITGRYSANAIFSENVGTFIVLGINDDNNRNLSASRYFLNGENNWEQLDYGNVPNAEIGNIAPNSQFSSPVIEVHDNYVITEHGYVFSRGTFELQAKLELDKPAVTASYGLIFEASDNGVNSLYELSTLELQRRNFAYETPFSARPWVLYKGTEELFFYASGDQLIRVGVSLFD
jgi:hypothetical protein